MALTDEQVAAELNHARSWSKRPGWVPQAGECESLADLALALQERLQAADAERDRMSDSATVIIRRAEAAEAERDEARQALPTDQQRQTLAYWLWPEAPGDWDDLAAAAKRLREAHDTWARESHLVRQQARSERDQEWWDALGGVPGVDATPEACKRWQMTLQEQARREAFEEAAKIQTEMLKLDHVKARRNPGGWIEDYINLAIVVDRALAEVER